MSYFVASVTPSINTFESSNDILISILLPISSFEITNVTSLPALLAPFPLILLSNVFITFKAAFEAILFTNPGKLYLEKGIVRSVITFLPN